MSSKKRGVYIDETGFNLWTKRSSGRLRKGTPAAIVTSGQKGQNMTLVLAISSAGVIHHEFIDGSLRGETFQQFLISTSAKVDGPCLFTYDNAPAHNNSSTSNSFHTVRKLPPWSPMLNPIEEAFSV